MTTVTPGTQAAALVLCLLIGNVHSQIAADDAYTVDGAANHNVTLPCSLTRPSNWKDNELQIIWFKNFADKLWDCAVKNEKAPDCWSSPNASRTQISLKFFKFDLEISALQESDAGRYQCWIILSDAYRRRDVLLRVHGVHREASGGDANAQRSGLVVASSSWTVLLLSGWSISIFLAGVLLAKRLCISERKRKRWLINVI